MGRTTRANARHTGGWWSHLVCRAAGSPSQVRRAGLPILRLVDDVMAGEVNGVLPRRKVGQVGGDDQLGQARVGQADRGVVGVRSGKDQIVGSPLGQGLTSEVVGVNHHPRKHEDQPQG